MLHMSIAANILIASGGRPMINTRAFIPNYPGPLPTAPPQVVSIEWFPPDKLFPITNPQTACRAIDIIKLEDPGSMPRKPKCAAMDCGSGPQ